MLERANQIFTKFGITKIVEKRGEKYGMTGTRRYDSKSVSFAIWSIVCSMKYNKKAYEEMVLEELIPKFSKNELVKYGNGVFRVNEVIIEENRFFYELVSEQSAKVMDKVPQNELSYYGISDKWTPLFLSHDGRVISQRDAVRLQEMIKDIFNEVKLPVSTAKQFPSVTLGGYGKYDVSMMIRTLLPESSKECFIGEVRLHIENTQSVRVTLWFSYGQIYYNKNIDLIERYTPKLRTVKEDSLRDTLKKAKSVIGYLIVKAQDDKDVLDSQLDEKISKSA